MRTWKELLAVSFAISVVLGVQASPVPKTSTPREIKESQLHNPPTYDARRSTWRAEKIRIAGSVPRMHGDAGWKADFSKGGGLPDIAKNVPGVAIQENCLRLTTGADALFSWGPLNKEDNVKLLSIGAAHTAYWHPLCLRVRIRQTLPESHWKAAWVWGQLNYWSAKMDSPWVVLKGTDVQELTFTLTDSRNGIQAMGLMSQESGNGVIIESIEAYTPSAPQCFRQVIELDEAPVDARLTVFKAPCYKLYINGKLVVDRLDARSGDVNFTGLEKHFRKGRNVVALESEYYNWGGMEPQLIVEGMVRGESGKITHLFTDKSWKAMFSAPSGWEMPDFDDQAWPAAESIGKPEAEVGYTVNSSSGGGMLNPPYYGPIELTPPVRNRYYLFDAGAPIKIPIHIYAYAASGNCDITWRLQEAETEKEVKAGLLAANQAGDRPFKGILEIEAPAPGAYELFVELKSNGKIVESRVEELAVIGRIEQREVAGSDYLEGLDLELTDTIDCADPNSPYTIFSETVNGKTIPAPVVEGKAGRYRESGADYYDWFGFAVKLDKLFEPYLLEVEIPDDADRIMSIRCVQMSGAAKTLCNDGSGRKGWPIGCAGPHLGVEYPNTDKMIPYRMIIWPKTPILGIEFMTQSVGLKAAAGKARLYRIRNGLPAAKCASPDYRLTGQHLERLNLLPFNFYAGPDDFKFAVNSCTMNRGYWKNWYNTGANMVRYMRFAGENMVIAGIYMYHPENDNFWRNRETANSIELLGRMCAANGLKLLIGVEYCRPEQSKMPRHTDDEVAAGAYSPNTVSKDGKQGPAFGMTGNIFAPEMRDDLQAMIADIARMYKDTPGIAGIGLQVGSAWMPGISHPSVNVTDPLDWGYDDITIGQFEKDTGTRVPVDTRDPQRFMKRYQWLMANDRDAWVDWRCIAIRQINESLARIVAESNTQWQLYLFPSFLKTPRISNEPGQTGAVESVRDTMRANSYDPLLYKRLDVEKSDGLWNRTLAGLGLLHEQKRSNLMFGNYCERTIRGYPELLPSREWYDNPEYLRLADGGTCFLANGFYESTRKSKTWYWDVSLPGEYVTPPERNFLRMFSRVMEYATPQVITQTWNDCIIKVGDEQTRREFNRAFRVLPPGPYTTLNDNGLNHNVVVRQGPELNKEMPFYVINPGPWPVEVKLSLAPEKNSQVRNLVSGDLLKVEASQLTLSLKPYEMVSLSLSGGGGITGATVRPADSIKAELHAKAAEKAALYEAATQIGVKRIGQGLVSLDLRRTTTEQLMADAREITAAFKAGDDLMLVNRTESYVSRKIEDFLRAMKTYMDSVKELRNSYRIDCGAFQDWTDESGHVWLADRQWLGGAADWGVDGGDCAVRDAKVRNATPTVEKVNKTQRYGMKRYGFHLRPGKYNVRMHFMEGWCNGPGERGFDVFVQGQKALSDVDMFKETGGKNISLTKELKATVEPDTILTIAFTSWKAEIGGIEIEPAE